MPTFPDITCQQDDTAFIVRSATPLTILSSAVVGGGYTQARVIINRHVHKAYDHPDPAQDLHDFARQNGINEAFVGLMTAVYIDHTQIIAQTHAGVQGALILTAGYSNATAAGLTPPADLRPGTINLILLLDAALSPAAMVNAVITATEAKTHILRRWDKRTPDGLPATGTSTDSVVVACTGRGPTHSYAGPVTPVGYLIGQMVRQGLQEARP